MKALVLGCGSIGLRHVGHLRELGLSDIEVADPSPAAREKLKQQFGISALADAEEALARRPDAVLVCTPADTHIPLVEKALAAGAHVFVEKPLSTGLQGSERLLQKVRADGRVVQVGYNLRYHPAVRATKRILDAGRLGRVVSAHLEFGLYLPKWWSNRDYRASYMANAGLGGGLLLDASHEIDLVLFFLGEVAEVTAYGGKLSGLEIQGLDVIKALLWTRGRALVSVHMDCVQPTYTRSFVLIGENAAVRWDCPMGRADGSLGRLLLCDRKANGYEPVQVEGNPAETYVGELRDFLDSIAGGKPPAIGVESGIEVLRVADAIQESMRTGSSVRIQETGAALEGARLSPPL